MIGPRHANPRRGYSLTVVLVFLILLFALWGAVYRTTSSLLRIETNRVLQQTRDQGAMNALAQAIQLLQYSKPNPIRPQFIYGVTVSVPNTDGSCGTATLDYTVVYTFAPIIGSPGDPNRWQVQVSPGTYSTPLPQIGPTILWP
jgi:Tfp pilus assembly protein PilX